MSAVESRTARILPGALWIAALLLAVLALIFVFLGRSVAQPSDAFGFRGFGALFAICFGTVGALVAHRQPQNPIGWLMCWMGVASGIQEFALQYAIYALLVRRGEVPAGEWAAWVPAWIWIPATVSSVFIFLIFPTGRLLSGRWRIVGYIAFTGGALATVAFALTPGPLESFSAVRNPIGAPGQRSAWLNWQLVGMGIYAFSLIVAGIGLIVRFRRSRGIERLQLKWVVAAASVVALALSSSFFFEGRGTTVSRWGEAAIVLSFLMIPVSAGVAILRYRLFDIDLIISRALVYAVLSAALGGVYVGAVIVFQTALARVTRGGDIAVAASTLFVAALFSPLKARVREFVDKRFYRRRYDMMKTTDAFAAALRRHIDLNALTSELRRAVVETVQPAHLSIWLTQPKQR